MDVIAQNSGIASLIIGACGTAIAIATMSIRLVTYVFKKRKKLLRPIRLLLRELRETAPTENDAPDSETELLKNLEGACESASKADSLDSSAPHLLALLSPVNAVSVLSSAEWLVESYAAHFMNMRDHKQWMHTGACVSAVSMVTESVISVIDFLHGAITVATRDGAASYSFEALEKIYSAAGMDDVSPETINGVMRALVLFLGAVIRFEKMLERDTVCPVKYSIWTDTDEGDDMSLYIIKIRDDIRNLLTSEIKPYRLERAKTRREAYVDDSSAPPVKKQKHLRKHDEY